MKITAPTLFLMWQRQLEMTVWQERVAHLVGFASYDDLPGQLAQIAKRIDRRADAWLHICEWADRRADAEVAERADSLRSMARHPHQFTAADLMAEQVTLGVSERWCRQYGSDAVSERRVA